MNQRMKRNGLACVLLAALLLLLSLTACGKSASQSAAYRPSAGNSSAAYEQSHEFRRAAHSLSKGHHRLIQTKIAHRYSYQ